MDATGEGRLCKFVLLMEFLNCAIFTVFLMQQEEEVQYGWDSNGSWNVMHLEVFLKPPGSESWGG